MAEEDWSGDNSVGGGAAAATAGGGAPSKQKKTRLSAAGCSNGPCAHMQAIVGADTHTSWPIAQTHTRLTVCWACNHRICEALLLLSHKSASRVDVEGELRALTKAPTNRLFFYRCHTAAWCRQQHLQQLTSSNGHTCLPVKEGCPVCSPSYWPLLLDQKPNSQQRQQCCRQLWHAHAHLTVCVCEAGNYTHKTQITLSLDQHTCNNKELKPPSASHLPPTTIHTLTRSQKSTAAWPQQGAKPPQASSVTMQHHCPPAHPLLLSNTQKSASLTQTSLKVSIRITQPPLSHTRHSMCQTHVTPPPPLSLSHTSVTRPWWGCHPSGQGSCWQPHATCCATACVRVRGSCCCRACGRCHGGSLGGSGSGSGPCTVMC